VSSSVGKASRVTVRETVYMVRSDRDWHAFPVLEGALAGCCV
jgi:hypothetical protein